MNRKGLFVVFEGTDGVGKTSVIDLLQKKIKETFPALKFRVTSDLAGTQLGRTLRALILDQKNVPPLVRAYLFASIRAENVEKIILPSLNKGWLVIADRYLDSSIIYQGIFEKVGCKRVKEINHHAIKGVYPDLTFVLMASNKKLSHNLHQRTVSDKFDEVNFQDKYEIISEYFKLATKDQHYVLIDADGDLNSSVENVWSKLEPFLKNLNSRKSNE